MKKYLYLFLFCSLLFANCNKQQALTTEELSFLGDWSSTDYFITIAANGYGFCQQKNKSDLEGRVGIKNDKITFKSDNGRQHKFNIDEFPFEENGAIMMELDGDLFYKH